jgi:hypothetical protein
VFFFLFSIKNIVEFLNKFTNSIVFKNHFLL